MTCGHCRQPKPVKARGLCWGCWRHEDIRNNYRAVPQSERACGRRGVLNGHRNGTLPSPTTALPGTREKLEVLAERAAKGQRLWHPLDA